ncbi:hypothetical protein MMC10_007300 [Thelotrema lepadinum]|nr:hypothetical protein [Thelotrema lepadinum]
MLASEPGNRPYSWEAELELYDVVSDSDDPRVIRLEEGALRLQSPSDSHGKVRVPNGIQTPVHRAALRGDPDRVLRLVQLKWSLFAQDKEGQTPLDILELRSYQGLHKLLDEHLKHGEVATAANGGLTLLKAAREGDKITVMRCLNQGVDPLLVDPDGHCSALILAASHGHVNAVGMLLQKKVEEQLRQRDRAQGETALHKAAAKGHVHVVRKLLEYLPDKEDRQCQGKTALYLATSNKHENVVDALLKANPPAQVFSRWGVWANGTVLHTAVRSRENDQVLRRLLRAEDSIKCLNHKNKDGHTPIWIAVLCDNLEVFELLRERGSSLNVVSNYGNNILHVAAEKGLEGFIKDNLQFFNVSDVEARNTAGDTPIRKAEKYPRIVKLLEEFGHGKSRPIATVIFAK